MSSPIVVVSGAIANKPLNGGAAWTRLNYVLGLKKLGFDVYFIEQLDPKSCVDESGKPASFESSANLSYFRRIAEQFGLAERFTLLSGNSTSNGLRHGDLLDIAGSASLLVNISGHLHSAPLRNTFRRKIYIDLDPGFTQFWYAAGNLATQIPDHDLYFSVGENIGRTDCLIPSNDVRWRPTRQPVVLDYWPVSAEGEPNRFTTVASWRGPYGPVNHGGRVFGSKVHEFRKYSGVPAQADATFEIALDIHPGDHRDLELLSRNSWRVVDPKVVVPEPFAFRRYIQTSGAEFSVAQEIYVDTRSGWFSDRTVRYLASGKPVLVQDTGFGNNYPTGCGLVSFSTTEEAIAGAHNITRNYNAHAAAARQMAETYFDSDIVLTKLLDEVGI